MLTIFVKLAANERRKGRVVSVAVQPELATDQDEHAEHPESGCAVGGSARRREHPDAEHPDDKPLRGGCRGVG